MEHNQSKLYALLNTLFYTYIDQQSPMRPQLQKLICLCAFLLCSRGRVSTPLGASESNPPTLQSSKKASQIFKWNSMKITSRNVGQNSSEYLQIRYLALYMLHFLKQQHMTINDTVESLVNIIAPLKITSYVGEAMLFSKWLLPRLRDYTCSKHIQESNQNLA